MNVRTKSEAEKPAATKRPAAKTASMSAAEVRAAMTAKLTTSALTEAHGKKLKMQAYTATECAELKLPAAKAGFLIPYFTLDGKVDKFFRYRYLEDTRNGFEVDVGTFENTIDYRIEKFTEFPAKIEAHKDELNDKTVVTFCTSGIRCEKASSYMKDQGFEEVFHLQGGILKYLESVPESESLWQGECFVFDQRVAVKHNLAVGEFDQCYACRHPLSPAEIQSPDYSPGISCPYCIASLSAEKRARLSERQKQVALAKQRGEIHIGETQLAEKRKK